MMINGYDSEDLVLSNDGSMYLTPQENTVVTITKDVDYINEEKKLIGKLTIPDGVRGVVRDAFKGHRICEVSVPEDLNAIAVGGDSSHFFTVECGFPYSISVRRSEYPLYKNEQLMTAILSWADRADYEAKRTHEKIMAAQEAGEECNLREKNFTIAFDGGVGVPEDLTRVLEECSITVVNEEAKRRQEVQTAILMNRVSPKSKKAFRDSKTVVANEPSNNTQNAEKLLEAFFGKDYQGPTIFDKMASPRQSVSQLSRRSSRSA